MMEYHKWILATESWDKETQLHIAPVYTIGNGLFCCRGFFEEEQEGVAGLGGIYMAGVFGKADYIPWREEGRELVNVPNFFAIKVRINGRLMVVDPAYTEGFSMQLDLKNAILRRSYTYKEKGSPLFRIELERFASKDYIYTAGQRISITPLMEGLEITLDLDICTTTTNLNLVSSEPYPVQPGRKQYKEDAHTQELASVTIEKPDEIKMAFGQKIAVQGARELSSKEGRRYKIETKVGVAAVLEKLISIAISVEDGLEVESLVSKRQKELRTYQEEWNAHKLAMQEFWNKSDIVLNGDDEDQLTIRYNILQLAQSCPSHTNRYSIGARGLTGEMYEGSVFWDTEIFMLPFFSLVHPQHAKKMLEFRYHTLPEAKKHATNNWFRGAMYGWQVNAQGVEQTPQGVGAYYSIHVISDIAYAILDYWNCTEDIEFMLHQGLEILVETARFWESRVTKQEDGSYDIIAVRGPNEYDVLVNNNLYTNMMARENFVLCRNLCYRFAETHSEEYNALKEKLRISKKEMEQWLIIEKHILLPYEESSNIWMEDDTYVRRMPLDMKKAKPTAKRIIDTTIPYEALPFYQVSKQADVLHLMKNLPWYFSDEQIQLAYEFYQPKTAFDSSLAYSMFALMAARLGRLEEAVAYYEKSSKLDIQNVQLNTISGLHFANFGGTWQALVFGFCGIEIQQKGLVINPHIPDKWTNLQFKLCYKGSWICFDISSKRIGMQILAGGVAKQVTITSGKKVYTLVEETLLEINVV